MRGTKLTIQFGLVSIPCKRGPVHKSTRVAAKRCCPECMEPTRQEMHCDEHGHVEPVSAYHDGERYVLVDRESLAVENDKVLRLTAFVDGFSPALFEKTELLHADKGAENPHSVLSEALRRRGGAAVGEMTLNKATRQVCVQFDEGLGCLTLSVLALNGDVRWDDVDAGAPGAVDDAQVDVAIQLLESLAETCELDAIDEYDERIRACVGKVERKLEAVDVPDLMEGLRASVADIASRKVA